MKSRIDILSEKLEKNIVDNDKEFFESLLDVNYRLKKLEFFVKFLSVVLFLMVIGICYIVNLILRFK